MDAERFRKGFEFRADRARTRDEQREVRRRVHHRANGEIDALHVLEASDREHVAARRTASQPCRQARRMVERGVRFVQIYSGGMDNELSWDGHANIQKNHSGFAAET